MASRIAFTIPLVPPSVNHYVAHTRKGKHYKTPAALAWEQAFAIYMPRDGFVTGKRFLVSLEVTLGPKDRLDVDNCPKCVLDAIARNHMLRNKSGRHLSDSYVKRLEVLIIDDKVSRALNQPKTEIVVEALGRCTAPRFTPGRLCERSILHNNSRPPALSSARGESCWEQS